LKINHLLSVSKQSLVLNWLW